MLLIDDKGETNEAMRSLARVGLDRVEGFLHKGMPAWIDAGMEYGRLAQLSTKEVAEKSSDVQVLDVRSDKEWQSSHIEGATHISLGELPDRLEEIAKDQAVIAVCGSGYRSSIASSLLQANGFSDVSSMDGGHDGLEPQATADRRSLSTRLRMLPSTASCPGCQLRRMR